MRPLANRTVRYWLFIIYAFTLCHNVRFIDNINNKASRWRFALPAEFGTASDAGDMASQDSDVPGVRTVGNIGRKLSRISIRGLVCPETADVVLENVVKFQFSFEFIIVYESLMLF